MHIKKIGNIGGYEGCGSSKNSSDNGLSDNYIHDNIIKEDESETQ